MPSNETSNDTSNDTSIIGNYYTLPPEELIWCINLQANIKFEKDLIVEITHTCIGSDFVFVKDKILLFNFPGMFPCLIDSLGTYGLSLSRLIPFTVPKYQPIIMSYNGIPV